MVRTNWVATSAHTPKLPYKNVEISKKFSAIENPQKFGHVLNGVMRSRGIKVLYIASPIDDWDFVEKVKKSVHSENLVITGKDLEGNCLKDIKLKFQKRLFLT